MKKTCNRCIALINDNGDSRCDLLFKQDGIYDKPLENCPKPLTAKEFVNEYNKSRGRNH